MRRGVFVLVFVLAGLGVCSYLTAQQKDVWWQVPSLQAQLDKLKEDLAYEVQRATNAEWCLQMVVVLNEGEYEGEQSPGEVDAAREYCTRAHLWPSRR